jgi:hypothetical protein
VPSGENAASQQWSRVVIVSSGQLDESQIFWKLKFFHPENFKIWRQWEPATVGFKVKHTTTTPSWTYSGIREKRIHI